MTPIIDDFGWCCYSDKERWVNEDGKKKKVKKKKRQELEVHQEKKRVTVISGIRETQRIIDWLMFDGRIKEYDDDEEVEDEDKDVDDDDDVEVKWKI